MTSPGIRPYSTLSPVIRTLSVLQLENQSVPSSFVPPFEKNHERYYKARRGLIGGIIGNSLYYSQYPIHYETVAKWMIPDVSFY
jgi:hypothetical protein